MQGHRQGSRRGRARAPKGAWGGGAVGARAAPPVAQCRRRAHPGHPSSHESPRGGRAAAGGGGHGGRGLGLSGHMRSQLMPRARLPRPRRPERKKARDSTGAAAVAPRQAGCVCGGGREPFAERRAVAVAVNGGRPRRAAWGEVQIPAWCRWQAAAALGAAPRADAPDSPPSPPGRGAACCHPFWHATYPPHQRAPPRRSRAPPLRSRRSRPSWTRSTRAPACPGGRPFRRPRLVRE
jgi:hypothetical protein